MPLLFPRYLRLVPDKPEPYSQVIPTPEMGLPHRAQQHQSRRCPLRTSSVSFTYPLLFLPATLTVAISSQVRQNYHPDFEAAINNHIQFQFYVSYHLPLSMAAFCNLGGLNQKHFTCFFMSKSHEWSALTEMFLTLQNERGGHISFRDIEKPDNDKWVMVCLPPGDDCQ
ncbi:similar to hypothetical protein (predicted), isoform CRA_a [Rattus norvegicus]|uniref:Uncharacterized protein RGD1561320_predicted n=1 Tax=Rattus norvegicus TaxID=10116 RepID=A6IPU3_RAT|nr:similar to hypothetical protein (predicted), isoform CRA_a [Rattus norvegicus]